MAALNAFYEEPATFTTGPGYTVSDGFGVYGDRYGYGHGVIDADLAVKLAEQWMTKGQNLGNELTFTSFYDPAASVNIPAAETADNGLLVPGGIGGTAGFINYWNEYLKPIDTMPMPPTGPFHPTGPANTRGSGYLEFSVPADNAMKIEWVEVKAAVGGNLSGLRVTLVSPDGTVSELNPFYVGGGGSPQSDGPWANVAVANPFAGVGAWTFTTNRSWGSRSDGELLYDPFTGDPTGETQNWRLYIENYGGAAASLGPLEVDWHGTRMDPNTQRVQGFVGVDENEDGMFNYSGVFQSIVESSDPMARRLGDLVTTRDVTQESFAANVTLQAKRASDGQVVAQFVTGADGNYYFDLVPDDYIISISEIDGVPVSQLNGTTLLDDAVTPDGYLQGFKAEWHIGKDWFNAWDRETVGDSTILLENLAPVDAQGNPVMFDNIPGPGVEHIPANIKNINFLLDVGPSDLSVNGVVFADVNGDGVFNGDDALARLHRLCRRQQQRRVRPGDRPLRHNGRQRQVRS